MLSGGEQQRIALARAVAPRPSVLLMDEPFSGLDRRLRDQVREDVLHVLRESRVTCVIVTHDAEEAMRIADRIALMRAGRLIQVGEPRAIYSAPNDGVGEPVSWRVRLMGPLSIWHWIIVIAVVLLLFGRGKISELMGDVAQGIKAFKKGMSEDEVAKTDPAKPEQMKVIDNDNAATAMKARSDTEKRVEGSTA